MADTIPESFHRVELLVGEGGFEALQKTSVILFGVGGVGSWAAEGLVRSGIGKLTIIDSDKVCITNVNRQLQATYETVGESKVEVLKKRLLTLNPDVEIHTFEMYYNEETAPLFNLNEYDYILDCIDTLAPKKFLIEAALQTETTFYSSMGAALKVDPTRVKVAPIHKTLGCPLARLMRKHLKYKRIRKKFITVFSDELLEPHVKEQVEGSKKQVNGSLVHITAQFGMMLSGLVIEDVINKVDTLIKVR